MPKGPKGSAGRDSKLDEKILRTAERAGRSRVSEDHADANSAERVVHHLHQKSGGTSDIPMEEG